MFVRDPHKATSRRPNICHNHYLCLFLNTSGIQQGDYKYIHATDMLPTTYFKVLILRTGVYLYTYTNKCTYVYILNIQTNYIWEHNFKRNFLGDSSIRSRLLSVAHWVSDEPMLCQSAITQHRAKWADLQHLRGSLHVPLLTPVSYNHYMYPLAITKL